MKCLVTGATGYTGSHLALALLKAGHQVRALVRPGSSSNNLAAAGVELFEGQLTEPADVLAAASGCEQIYHIAAVFRTAGHPDSHYRAVNRDGAVNVLEAARQHGCERVIHCSTIGVHGHIEQPPATETYRFRPDDIYQVTKLEGEMEAAAAMRRGQPVTIVRPGSIYGEGDLRFLKLFRAIQRQRFIMLGSGKVRLHLVHIDNLIQGIMLCGSQRAAIGETFIITGPEALPLNEIIALIAAAVGAPRPRIHLPVWPIYAAGWACEMLCIPFGIDPPLHRRRVGFFTHHREFDISKARQLLGYDPRITVAQGITRTARWYADQGLLAPLKAPQPPPEKPQIDPLNSLEG